MAKKTTNESIKQLEKIIRTTENPSLRRVLKYVVIAAESPHLGDLAHFMGQAYGLAAYQIDSTRG